MSHFTNTMGDGDNEVSGNVSASLMTPTPLQQQQHYIPQTLSTLNHTAILLPVLKPLQSKRRQHIKHINRAIKTPK
jgi:hypothetical protein